MIIYHPYKDANHCAYRLISIMYGVIGEISLNFLNIADFYYLFPSELKAICNWPRRNSIDFQTVIKVEDCHENLGNAPMVFYEMKEIQHNAFLNLISRGIVAESKALSQHYILVRDSLPDSLVEVLESDIFRKSQIYKLITLKLSKLPLHGENGLKAKTGLLEYRYDK